MAAAKEFIKGEIHNYTIDVDGVKIVEDFVANSVCVMNCKYAA